MAVVRRQRQRTLQRQQARQATRTTDEATLAGAAAEGAGAAAGAGGGATEGAAAGVTRVDDVLFWSGGKDAYLSLLHLQEAKRRVRQTNSVVLLTTFDSATGIVPHQGACL
jgi:hypothetical protein